MAQVRGGWMLDTTVDILQVWVGKACSNVQAS
jgi:hypothetical protein